MTVHDHAAGNQGSPKPLNIYLVITSIFLSSVLVLTIVFNVVGSSNVDVWLSTSINQLSRKSVLFDSICMSLIRSMFSGVLLVGVFVYAWFRSEDEKPKSKLLIGMIAAFISGVLSRTLQKSLPTHLRPLHDLDLVFTPPYSVDASTLNHWSSYPSDHAAVFFGIATAIFVVDRSAGLAALLIAVVTNLDRMYLGFHWSTDIIGGGVLGSLCVLASMPARRSAPVRYAVSFEHNHRPWFFAIGFLFLFGVSTLFDDLRGAIFDVRNALHEHGTQ